MMKFGGTTAGSSKDDYRIKDARLLIEAKVKEGYFVIPVFSAIRRAEARSALPSGITDTLLRYRSLIAAEGLEGFVDALWLPHVELARDLKLISETTFDVLAKPRNRNFRGIQEGTKGCAGDWHFIQNLWTEVRRLASRASTYYDEPPSPFGLDALAVGGERLIVLIIEQYLNSKWIASRYPYRAKARTARDIGILTDGNFGDANILRGTKFELLVAKKLLEDAKRKTIPVVTGFDGIYKETGEAVDTTIDIPPSGDEPERLCDSLRAALDRLFKQPELRQRAVRQVRLTCVLATQNGQRRANHWDQQDLSTELTLPTPAKSADPVLQALRPQLLSLPEHVGGRRISQVSLRLSGIHHDQGFVTTLGRGGSDLTATYIAKAVRAEAIYLLKDTLGVQTANPKVVPDAYTITQLPYELAIEAGNVQHKAVQPAMEVNLPIEVFNPKFPDIRTIIGPYEIENRLYLIPNPIRARSLTISTPPNKSANLVVQELVAELCRLEGLELLEMRYDPNSISILLKESGDVEYLERYVQQHLRSQPRSESCHYLRVVGSATAEVIDIFVAAIAPFRPLLYPVGCSSTHALSAALPGDVDINDVVRTVHETVLTRPSPRDGN